MGGKADQQRSAFFVSICLRHVQHGSRTMVHQRDGIHLQSTSRNLRLETKEMAMTIDEVKQNIGKKVMTDDPGDKLARSLRPHGPYKIKQLTKAGVVVLEGYDYRVAPSSLKLVEGQ
jgi:hypothetical protein